ncbi:hypothetical protein BSNK01_01840 [Bacillaceae bacterium]
MKKVDKRKRIPGPKAAALTLTGALLLSGFPVPAGVVDAADGKPVNEASQQATADLAKEAKVTKEQALKTAKEFAQVPADYKLASSHFETSWHDRAVPVWRFYWNRESNEKHAGFEVVVEAINGEVVALNWWQGDDQPASFPPKVNLQKAETIARDFVKQRFASRAGEVKLETREDPNARVPLGGPVTYPFAFVRLVDGIPFPQNQIMVNVNGNGEIVSVNYRWDTDLSFPAANVQVSPSDAERRLKERLDLHLRYIRTPGPMNIDNEKEEPQIFLGYLQPFAYDHTYVIDAKTGEILDPYGEKADSWEKPDYSPLVNEPLGNEPETPLHELTQERAVAAVKRFFPIAAELKLRDARYVEGWRGEGTAVWDLNWERREKDHAGYEWLRVVVDAKTGQILEVNREGKPLSENERPGEGKGMTKAAAKEKAVEWIKRLSPSYVHQVYYKGNANPWERHDAQRFHFYFERLVNGIPVHDQGINLQLDARTGEIVHYFVNWQDWKFPQPGQGLLGEAEAREQLLSPIGVELSYFVPEPRYWLPNDQERADRQKPILVYRLVNKVREGRPMFLDAESRQWRSLETGEIVRGRELPRDIKGHWAEKELELMYRYNAFEVQDGKVYPDEHIKRGELVKMLILAMHQGRFIYYGNREAAFADVKADSKYFPYVQAAAEQNLLDTSKKALKPEETIDREELAVLLTRALGYGPLAREADIFKLPFVDGDEIEAKGAVAIASGLGILPGEGDRFQPAAKVTRAQAAVAFYRFLQKRAEFTPERHPRY